MASPEGRLTQSLRPKLQKKDQGRKRMQNGVERGGRGRGAEILTVIRLG